MIAEALEDTETRVEVLARPAVQNTTAWPPLDVLFIVHLERLDQWVPTLSALVDGRGHLSDTHQVSAVPTRHGVAIPFLGRVILPEQRVVLPGRAYQWDEHAWQDWRPGGRYLSGGTAPGFRQLLGSAATISSLAALPGGVRPGIEEKTLSSFNVSLVEELGSLEEVVEDRPDSTLLEEAVSIARVIAESAKQELSSSDESRGEIARWCLNMMDGVEDDLARKVNGAVLLLAEWDVDPESANQWYAELTDQ